MIVEYINWWGNHDIETQDKWFDRFFQRCCKDYENINNSNIVIYSIFGSIYNLTKVKEDNVNIFFNGESTVFRYKEYSNEEWISQYMDILLTFHKTTKKGIRYPLWLLYWDFYENGLFHSRQNSSRKDAVILIANHDPGNIRKQLCNIIKNTGIDVYCNNKLFEPISHIHKVGPTVKDKIDVLTQYKYNICPENCYSEGYITEKIFHSFEAGCIPIYYGNKEVEKGIIKQDKILTIDNIQHMNHYNIDDDFWDNNALIEIYMIYLTLWSRVYKKLRDKNKNMKIKDNVEIISYKVKDKSNAIVVLKEHWNKYKKFIEPRPQFEIEDENKIISMEELIYK